VTRAGCCWGVLPTHRSCACLLTFCLICITRASPPIFGAVHCLPAFPPLVNFVCCALLVFPSVCSVCSVRSVLPAPCLSVGCDCNRSATCHARKRQQTDQLITRPAHRFNFEGAVAWWVSRRLHKQQDPIKRRCILQTKKGGRSPRAKSMGPPRLIQARAAPYQAAELVHRCAGLGSANMVLPVW